MQNIMGWPQEKISSSLLATRPINVVKSQQSLASEGPDLLRKKRNSMPKELLDLAITYLQRLDIYMGLEPEGAESRGDKTENWVSRIDQN